MLTRIAVGVVEVVGVRRTFEAVVDLGRGGVELGAIGKQVHARHVPRLGDLDVAFRDVDAKARGDHVQVLLERLLDPGFLVRGLRLIERHLLARLGECLVGLAGDLPQHFLGAGERALRGDDTGRRAIVGSAGFLHVGDRNQADLEALLGLLELPGDRLERRFGRRQRVLGGQHVEICL